YECVLELLRYPDIDHNLTDGFGLTPLELCQRSEENFPTREHQQSTASLSVPVHLVDGSLHLMILPYRDATTVRQLHLRIMGSLGLTDPRDNLFTLWVCSQNLRLQLKPMHKPVQLMRDWRSKTVPLFTSANPMKEDPKLFLRRNALHAQCTIDGRRVKAFLQSEQNLAGVLPEPSRRVSRLPAGLTSAVAKRYSSSGLRRELEALSLSECHTNFSPSAADWPCLTPYSLLANCQLCLASLVFIGVNDIGLHLLGDPSKRFLYSFHYPNFNWSEIARRHSGSSRHTKSGETTPMRLLSPASYGGPPDGAAGRGELAGGQSVQCAGHSAPDAQPSPFPGVGGANRTGAAAGNQAPGGVDHARFFAEQITRTAQTIVALIDSLPGPRPTEPIRIRMAELEEENHRLGRHLIEVVDQLEARLRRVRACLTDIAQVQLRCGAMESALLLHQETARSCTAPNAAPEFVDQPPSPSSSSKSSSKPAAARRIVRGHPAGLVIGPLPSEHRILDELRHAPRFQAAAAPQTSARKSGVAPPEKNGFPPETLASSLMTAGRKRPAGQPDKSWTRIGDGDEEAEAAPAEDAQAAAERRQQAALEMQGARLHDAEMSGWRRPSGWAAAPSGSSRCCCSTESSWSWSSVSARRRKLRNGKRRRRKEKDKKKKSKKKRSRKSSSSSSDSSSGPSRVPFNRDTDMVVKGLDFEGRHGQQVQSWRSKVPVVF
uniref:ANK_REP_REGION domain-containing protein n=1 Tax=Macrostomum lignano TaxID=282301 RepID=A0A1I8IXW8_9PLAT